LAAEVDRLLLELIKRFIKEERKKDGDERLFGGFGPLQSFGVRIEIAYRLGLISKEDADGMDMMRKLRNHCAHTIQEFSLEAEPFKSQFLHFMELTSKRDNLGLFIFGVLCPKTNEELVLGACIELPQIKRHRERG
jgi:DNA-binding MltR family transcriptional regulator